MTDQIKTGIEVLLLTLVIYTFIRFLQKTRGGGVMRGFIISVVTLVVMLGLSVNLFELEHLGYLTQRGITAFLITLVVLFQPELRQALVKVGDYSPWTARGFDAGAEVLREVREAAKRMSRRRCGALIVLERSTGLRAFAESGVKLDARVSAKLLHCIFFKDSPLHDGAVLIQGDRISAAACQLPNSESPTLPDTLGLRHRAALGIAEESDALVIVVSEETGRISVAHQGRVEVHVSQTRLEEILSAEKVSVQPVSHGDSMVIEAPGKEEA